MSKALLFSIPWENKGQTRELLNSNLLPESCEQLSLSATEIRFQGHHPLLPALFHFLRGLLSFLYLELLLCVLAFNLSLDICPSTLHTFVVLVSFFSSFSYLSIRRVSWFLGLFLSRISRQFAAGQVSIPPFSLWMTNPEARSRPAEGERLRNAKTRKYKGRKKIEQMTFTAVPTSDDKGNKREMNN